MTPLRPGHIFRVIHTFITKNTNNLVLASKINIKIWVPSTYNMGC